MITHVPIKWCSRIVGQRAYIPIFYSTLLLLLIILDLGDHNVKVKIKNQLSKLYF